MKAEYLGHTVRPGGAGYTSRRFLYQTLQTAPACQFEIRAPFKEGLRAPEGLKFIGTFEKKRIEYLHLKITFGTTTVTKIFTERDRICEEFIMDLTLGLCDRIKAGKPDFEVDIDIYFAT